MAHRMSTPFRRLRIVMVGAALVASPPAALACGYHDDVSLARGVLNWVYPDALHVVGAISAAVSERRLPAVAPGRGMTGLSGYHATARDLRQYAALLRAQTDEALPAFSLLLVEPMLWTRFVAADGRLSVQLHVAAPRPGDLVLVSGEAVVHAIANGRLTIGEAHRRGLVRFYGAPDQVARFLALYAGVGSLAPGDGEPSQLR
jgi:hypothetical protein